MSWRTWPPVGQDYDINQRWRLWDFVQLSSQLLPGTDFTMAGLNHPSSSTNWAWFTSLVSLCQLSPRNRSFDVLYAITSCHKKKEPLWLTTLSTHSRQCRFAILKPNIHDQTKSCPFPYRFVLIPSFPAYQARINYYAISSAASIIGSAGLRRIARFPPCREQRSKDLCPYWWPLNHQPIVSVSLIYFRVKEAQLLSETRCKTSFTVWYRFFRVAITANTTTICYDFLYSRFSFEIFILLYDIFETHVSTLI